MKFIIDVEGFLFEGETFLEAMYELHCDTMKGFSQLVLEDCCTNEDLNDVLPVLWKVFENSKEAINDEMAHEIINEYQKGIYMYDRNASTIKLSIEWED